MRATIIAVALLSTPRIVSAQQREVRIAGSDGYIHVKAAVILSGPHSEEQRAFVARTTGFSVLAVASDGEGSEQYMKPIAQASRHPQSRLIVLEGRSHGMLMLSDATGLEPDVLRWLMDRLTNPEQP